MVKQAQIFFWDGNNEGLLGKAIQYFNMKTFGRSDCTHCGIIAFQDDKQVLIYEAGNKGFQPRIVTPDWLKQKQIKIGITKENLKEVIEVCRKYENIKYGWFDLIAIILKYFTGLNLNITGKNSLICSEAVCRVLYDCSKGIDFQKEYKIPFDLITPEHIF